MRTILFEDDFLKIESINEIYIGTIKYPVVDLEISKNISEKRLKIQKGIPSPILSNIKSVKTVTKEARDFMASESGCEGVIAAAVLIDSTIGSMIGNFFIRISKPLRPTRIFTNEKDAIKWLEQYKIA